MQLHFKKQMDDNLSILSQKVIKIYKSSQYANDPEFLKLSKFMECSYKFKAFMNSYAQIKFKDDSDFWYKWEVNNKENNGVLYELVKFISDEDIDVKYLADRIPQLKEDLNKYFDNVYQFVRKEIENYKHYVKAIKYSQGITEIEEEKIEYLKGYHIPKYDNNVSYDKYSKKIKEYESRLSR